MKEQLNYMLKGIEPSKDREALINFWEKNLKKYFSGRFEWFYKDNPAGEPLGTLAYDREKKIIGHGSICLRRIYFKGLYLKVGIASDFLVDEKYRVFGPALPIQKANLNFVHSKQVDFIYVFPNQASKAVFHRLGYKQIGTAISYNKILVHKQKLSNIGIPKMIAAAIGPILDSITKLIDSIILVKKPKNLNSSRISKF